MLCNEVAYFRSLFVDFLDILEDDFAMPLNLIDTILDLLRDELVNLGVLGIQFLLYIDHIRLLILFDFLHCGIEVVTNTQCLGYLVKDELQLMDPSHISSCLFACSLQFLFVEAHALDRVGEEAKY